MTANIIFLISDGRTGSTVLCQLLTHYKHTINFNEAIGDVDNTELFHHDRGFNDMLKAKYNLTNELELHRLLRKDPINLIKEMSGYFSDTLIAKLHLTQFHLFEKNVLNWILSQPNHKFILLERTNFLKRYVSEKIAKQSNRWHNVNTTDTKVKIDTSDFSDNLHAYRIRYDNIKKNLKDHNVDYLVVEYDKDLKQYNADDFINLVDPWIKRTGLDLQLGDQPIIGTKRQNNNEDIFDNIMNVEEMQELVKNNIFACNTNYRPI